jgi:serine/threonine-protein kinase
MELRDQLQQTLGSAYSLERELTGGGMSRVFVAEDTALGRKVVVKVLPPETAAQVSIARFKREIALAARLQHPHIVPLLSAGESEGLPYFTMPFVEGESLRVRIAKGGELPIAEGLRILREVASALDYAHEQGIVHRDIKPDNVLLSRGSAMVTDFGVAKALSESSNAEQGKVTSLGVALGTPAYMSPEQATAAPNIDARADIYALGVLAYELFAGRPPFAGRSPQATLAAQVTEAPEQIAKLRTSLPPGLSSLIMRCLEKTPADRPQSAADVVHALDAITTPSGGTQPTSAVSAFPSVTVPTPTRPRSVAIAAAASAAVLLIIGFGYWTTHRNGESGSPAAVANGEKHIAVMPFEAASRDSVNDAFADGMTDELTAALGKVPGLRLASRSAVYAYHDSTVDPKRVGARLGVEALLTGTVRRSGNRMKVTAQLINVGDGLSTWSDSYERDAKDFFAVEDSISLAIVSQLKLTLGAGVHSVVVAGTQNTEAHDLYLQGMFYWRKLTEPDLRKSLTLFERATMKDPKYAAPWAGVAYAWIDLADDWLAPRDAEPKALAAVRMALVLDSTSADAWGELAFIEQFYLYDFSAAAQHLARAMRLDPQSGTVHSGLSDLLWRNGSRDSALAERRRAVELDPVERYFAWHLADTFANVSRFDSAEVWYQKAFDLDPTYVRSHGGRLRLWMRQGRWADARDEALHADAEPSWQESWIAICEAHLGRTADAQRRVAALEAKRGPTQYVAADYIAQVHAALGDRDAAFRWLDQAFADRSANLTNMTGGEWDPIRDDPRFRALERRINSSPLTR